MRHAGPLAARSPSWPSRYRDRGVVGFDIAGAEAGYPPTRHLDAFEYLQRENAHFTIHAGEAFGLPSIWQAIQWCGADRLGHGVRIIDDITVDDDGVGRARPARRVRPRQAHPAGDVPDAPTCRPAPPTSIAEHPIGLLRRLRFRVTVNTDNRLMSGTSMTPEMAGSGRGVRLHAGRPAWFTVNAMKSAFLPFDERLAMIDDVIKPGYAAPHQRLAALLSAVGLGERLVGRGGGAAVATAGRRCDAGRASGRPRGGSARAAACGARAGRG